MDHYDGVTRVFIRRTVRLLSKLSDHFKSFFNVLPILAAWSAVRQEAGEEENMSLQAVGGGRRWQRGEISSQERRQEAANMSLRAAVGGGRDQDSRCGRGSAHWMRAGTVNSIERDIPRTGHPVYTCS